MPTRETLRAKNVPVRSARLMMVMSMFLGAALRSLSQTPATPPAPPTVSTFEEVSIRMVEPHSLEDLQRGIGVGSVSAFPANLFTARFMTLRVIISVAFGVAGNRISGEPEWLDQQLYEINAKVEGDTMLTHEQMEPLLQRLLEQRFHLSVHRESKLVSGYALVAAKGGAKLQPAKGGDKSFCYVLPNGIDGSGTDMKTLALALERPAGHPVVDKTGIADGFDIKLRYAPANDSKSDQPDFFTAVQEQLGLKLEPQKVPVEMLAIDHVDKIPTEN